MITTIITISDDDSNRNKKIIMAMITIIETTALAVILITILILKFRMQSIVKCITFYSTKFFSIFSRSVKRIMKYTTATIT